MQRVAAQRVESPVFGLPVLELTSASWSHKVVGGVAADDCQDAREAHLAAHLQHVVDMNRPEKVGDRDQVAHHPLFSVCGARRETRNLQPVRTSEDNP